ncbi:MAG: helicase, partial [Gammaproteobacteria bacterium]
FSLCSIDWGMVVFDEAQNIKNPNAIQTRAAKGLNSDFKLLVTGTPVENSLADFWCLMDTAVPGHLYSYQDFRKKYIKPILEANKPILDIVNSNAKSVQLDIGLMLRKDVGHLMLRRTKEDVFSQDASQSKYGEGKALPQKIVYVGLLDDASEDSTYKYRQSLSSTMHDFQLATYEAVINEYRKAEHNQALACLHNLRDISLHPQLGNQGTLIGRKKTINDLKKTIGQSRKLTSLIVQLDSIKKLNEKCIVFCINKRLQEFLSLALTSIYSVPVHVINGDTKAVAKKQSSETRKSIISAFEAHEGFNIIIMSPIAAGVGLTITGANHVIHLERHWNPAKE